MCDDERVPLLVTMADQNRHKLSLKDQVKNYFQVEPKEFIRRRFPITKWISHYTISLLLQDLLAGFTVALTEIPQGIAYAGVAGLPAEYGLYCGFMGGFVYLIFGTCKDVNIGPTSIMALLIQDHVTRVGYDMAIIITFLGGAIIFVLGLLNLGFVIEFFSYPIIAGFTCAASMQIASSQIKSLFGIPGKANEFLPSLEAVFDNLDQIRTWDTVLGFVSLIFLFALKEIQRFGTLQYRADWSRNRNILGIFIYMLSLARNALVVIICTFLAYKLDDDKPFKITGDVKEGFPPFEPPPFSTHSNSTNEFYNFGDIAQDYGASLAFIPLVAILEAISIAKAFSKGKPLDATQEMIALGLCNIAGSFVRSMPVTGSFTRTAVNHASGARTTIAGVCTSLVVLLALAFLTPTFRYVPKATLASVIMCAMFYLFDFNAFKVIWRSKKLDMVPFLTTFLCCLFISLEYGILIGIGVNLLFVLFASARPKMDTFRKTEPSGNETFVIKPKDTLYFPAAEYLRDTILEIDENTTVIIDGKLIRNVDVTVAKSMAVFAQELNARNQSIYFVNFKKSVIDICVKVDPKLAPYFKDDSQFQINGLEQTTEPV